MNAYVYIAVSVLIFGLLSTYWKSKNYLVLLLLFAGNVLSSSLSGNLSILASDYVSTESFPLSNAVRVLLILIPAILAVFITKGSSKKKLSVPNFILGLVSSCLAYLWFLRALPYEQFALIESGDFTSLLLRFRDLVSGVGILLCMLVILIDSKGGKKSKKTHKSKD